jgi:hypothetical protein
MDIWTPAGFSKLNARERVVASVVLSILSDLNRINPDMGDMYRSEIMDDIEADVIKLAKLFY